MTVLDHDSLCRALREMGLKEGDLVHVQSDLRRPGPVAVDASERQAIVEFYFRAFQEVLGPEGTLCVHTPFEDYARFGTPFHRESSPSRGGAFSEYLRRRAGAIRSRHPIVSLCALGPLAETICNGNHQSGFGYDSPWGQLHRHNAFLLALGMGVEQDGGTSFLHYVEALYGVPHLYTKIYDTPVYDRGRRLRGPFTMAVRYLDFSVVHDSLRLRRRLVDTGAMQEQPLGRGRMMGGRASDIFDAAVAAFREDPYCILERPPCFRSGEIPMDGCTGPEIYRGET
jgi:aminoglycoside N3'-acetyltransferase